MCTLLHIKRVSSDSKADTKRYLLHKTLEIGGGNQLGNSRDDNWQWKKEFVIVKDKRGMGVIRSIGVIEIAVVVKL